MKLLWVVRIVVPVDDTLAGGSFRKWLEQMRYAGIVHLIRRDDEGYCFDFYPPRNVNGVDSKEWADRQASRMISFGINAVPAPEDKP